MDKTSVFAEIIKTAPQADGSLLVYGKATGSDLDLDHQQCDATWLKRAMPEWFKIGNVRESHDAKRAVGKATEYEATADGDHMITAKVLDPLSKAKIEAGILTGFSIGIKSPRIMKSATVKNGIITDGQIIEVSLVDRPALPTATLTICKSAEVGWEGSPEDYDAEKGLVRCEELTIQNEEAAKAAGDSEETKKPTSPKKPIEDEEDDEGEEKEKAVKPSPLDMPGAQPSINITLDGKAFKDKVETISKSTINDALAALTKAIESHPDRAEVVEKATNVDRLSDPAPGQICANCGEDGHLTCKTVEMDGATDEVVEKSEEADDSFDIESTKALVESILKGDGLGQNESGDISGAERAISQIAQLVISEAKALADMPAQDCDIHLLMNAVDALRLFSNREKLEGQSIDPDSVLMSAKADAGKGSKYSADEMAAMLKSGEAMANLTGNPSFPIADEEDLVVAIEKSPTQDVVRRHIIERAEALGKSERLPDDWTSKTIESEGEPALDISKALVGAFEDEESDLYKAFGSRIEDAIAKALSAHAEKTSKAFEETFGARLATVEKMATPGGPALRRTESEVKTSRRQDLLGLAEIEERKASTPGLDSTFRMGYQEKAARLRADANSL